VRGYVAKKGNRWYAVIYDGINAATGKEQRRWVAAGTRRGDAEKLVTDLVRRRNDGEEVVTERINLADEGAEYSIVSVSAVSTCVGCGLGVAV